MKHEDWKTYRKRPVAIRAIQLTMENSAEIKAVVGGRDWSRPPTRAVTGIIVPTLEGQHEASFDDWIVQGVKGEFYPVKPAIFEATYDETQP